MWKRILFWKFWNLTEIEGPFQFKWGSSMGTKIMLWGPPTRTYIPKALGSQTLPCTSSLLRANPKHLNSASETIAWTRASILALTFAPSWRKKGMGPLHFAWPCSGWATTVALPQYHDAPRCRHCLKTKALVSSCWKSILQGR
jgi:hypothetical protein